MKEFGNYHPTVNFTYFVLVIGFSMFLMNPLTLAISFVVGFVCSAFAGGKKAVKFNLLIMLPLMIFSALINTLFNHRGVTVLAYFPGGNPLTAESLAYGFAAAVMIGAVICHFSFYNRIMTSDKFIYIFGKAVPSISLVFSMVLRFVPRFKNHMKEIARARKAMGEDLSGGSMIKRAKSGIRILSAMTSWALENSIETADSMKSRGYGEKKRTCYSIYRLEKRDVILLAIMIILAIYIFVSRNAIGYTYFPSMKWNGITPYTISVLIAYFLLCLMPVITELREVWRWILLKRKI